MSRNTQITTGRVRFSFPHLFQPYAANDGQEPKYSVTLLIDKKDSYTVTKIRSAMEAAKADYIEKNPGKRAPQKNTLHDGDGVRDSGEPFGPECKGCYVVTVSTKRPPLLVYSDKTPITDEFDLYAGCYGRAIINAFVYDTAGNKGLTFGLNGIMKLSDGEPLSGGVVKADDFDDDWQDAGSDLPFDVDDPLLG